FFQGVQIVLADFQDARDFRQIFALALSRVAQVLADGFQGSVRVVGYFAQMQAAAFEPAALIKRKSCDLWHSACCYCPGPGVIRPRSQALNRPGPSFAIKPEARLRHNRQAASVAPRPPQNPEETQRLDSCHPKPA